MIKRVMNFMGKRKLCASILIGSIVGGIVAMTDPRVRRYTKEKVTCLSEKTVKVIKNPSETTERIKTTFNQMNDQIAKGTKWALHTLESIESTLNTLTKE